MSIGFWQVLLILLIILIIFGAGKLPQVMGDLAKSVKSFKAGMKDDEPPPAEPSKSMPTDPPAVAGPVVKRDEHASS